MSKDKKTTHGEITCEIVSGLLDTLRTTTPGRSFEKCVDEVWASFKFEEKPNEFFVQSDAKPVFMENFLIKSIDKTFPDIEDRSSAKRRELSLLMFGLLDGYYHTEILNGEARCIDSRARYQRYLNESNFVSLEYPGERSYSEIRARFQEEEKKKPKEKRKSQDKVLNAITSNNRVNKVKISRMICKIIVDKEYKNYSSEAESDERGLRINLPPLCYTSGEFEPIEDKTDPKSDSQNLDELFENKKDDNQTKPSISESPQNLANELCGMFFDLRSDNTYFKAIVEKLDYIPTEIIFSLHRDFCKLYIIRIIQRYCKSLDEVEFLLAMYGLLRGFEEEKCGKIENRKIAYYKYVHNLRSNKKIDKDNICENYIEKHKEILSNLIDKVLADLHNENNKLGIANSITEDFRNPKVYDFKTGRLFLPEPCIHLNNRKRILRQLVIHKEIVVLIFAVILASIGCHNYAKYQMNKMPDASRGGGIYKEKSELRLGDFEISKEKEYSFGDDTDANVNTPVD